VRINIADTAPEQGVTFDERQHFVVIGNGCLGQILQRTDDVGALAEAANRQFAGDERVGQHLLAIQQVRQHGVVIAKVVDPD